MSSQAAKSDRPERVDVIVVGAGFAGLYMLYKLRQMGRSAIVFEAGSGVGGTWYWNRYPGARCDAESMVYSYSFDQDLEQEWDWSERYSTQGEILSYAEHVAERFDLLRDIELNTKVTAARFDDTTNTWTVETDQGHRVVGQFCIDAGNESSLISVKLVRPNEVHLAA